MAKQRKSAGGGAERQSGDDASPTQLATGIRDALSEGLIESLGVVMLTRDRIEDALEDAVTRGRVTADDAQDLLTSLIERGRRQTDDVLAELDRLLVKGAQPIVAKAERARRAAKLGSSLPISGYDDLTAAEIQRRLRDLSPAELREVREHERRNAKRKTVLEAVAKRLR